MALDNICIDQRDLIPRKYEIVYDTVSKRRRDSYNLRDLLDVTEASFKNFEIGRGVGIKYENKLLKDFGLKSVKCRKVGSVIRKHVIIMNINIQTSNQNYREKKYLISQRRVCNPYNNNFLVSVITGGSNTTRPPSHMKMKKH